MTDRLDAHTREALVRLKDRALSATAEGIAIAREPDRPLIYVNEGFERLTGYPREEVIGRELPLRPRRGDGRGNDHRDPAVRGSTTSR